MLLSEPITNYPRGKVDAFQALENPGKASLEGVFLAKYGGCNDCNVLIGVFDSQAER